MEPCDYHFDKPCVVYKPGDPTCVRIDQSSRYDKFVCETCKWTIASRKYHEVKFREKEHISFTGKIELPDHMKLKFNVFPGDISYEKGSYYHPE